jgi:hypothetical protein
VFPFDPQTCVWFVVFIAWKESAVGAAPAAEGILNPAVTEAALRSRMPEDPKLPVWLDTVKSAHPVKAAPDPPLTAIWPEVADSTAHVEPNAQLWPLTVVAAPEAAFPFNCV